MFAFWNWQERRDGFGDWECVCTNCGKHAPFNEKGLVNMTTFCPHCGKRMIIRSNTDKTKGSEEYAKY